MTKRAIRIALLMALVAAAVLAGTITTYDIDFPASGVGKIPYSGGFVYDSTSDTFLDFNIVLAGTVYSVTAGANSPSTYEYATNPCGLLTGGALGFAIMSQTCDAGTNYFWDGYGESIHFFAEGEISGDAEISAPTPGVYAGFGTWSIVEVQTVPEPAMLPITLIAGAIMARKRITRGLRQAAQARR
jgi:hypothetical protein